MTLDGLKYYLKNPRQIYAFLASRRMLKWMSDKAFLKLAFRMNTGKKLNLKNPQTFNEKLQWLKLYDRKPEYTRMVDKYEAKKYVAERIGEEYIIPTLGVWDQFEDIDFDALPDQFVLKCTHDSGGLVICRDKSKLDKEAAKGRIDRCLKRNYYYLGREWPYKDVKPRIIAEQYIEDTEDDALTDYKYFCFNGIPKVMYISKDHGKNPRTDFFDMDFNHLPIRGRDPNADICPTKPNNFCEMKEIAAQLSKGIPHLRVDFYSIKGKVYVGELTFAHMSGMTEIKPAEWNHKLGEWITLPTVKE